MRKLKETAEAVADNANGQILASVEIAAPPERVFSTTEWRGDIRVGGRWRSAGIARGEAYAIEGEFLEIDPPRKLVITWQRMGAQEAPTTVDYALERIDGGTRITVRHWGFLSAEMCSNVAAGWKTAFEALVQLLAA